MRSITKLSGIAACAAWIWTLAPGLARAELPVVPVQVVKTWPHDPHAFTEGLFFRDGLLYESTGLEGQSAIRVEDLATGRVLRGVAIPPELFGEGIVAWKDQLISVTWRSGTGFRWSLANFRRLGEFHYDGEGWGLTEDGRNIILSDGTPTLRFLDPLTLNVVRRLSVTADGQPVERLNELEWVKGEILANIWMTDRIARIDPASGRVKGWIDVGALARTIGDTDPDAVPNGIAYDSARNRLFVTGKDWPLLFEVRVPGLTGRP
ncbi:MAG TPA: glutaminyl-peptide cyclotransferase [Rhizomicrobium sp.]|jgi:glutamine cyclotransferase|nr:glutaminyl-peptide cyclotransferase [Rhizomicrobium sp.]